MCVFVCVCVVVWRYSIFARLDIARLVHKVLEVENDSPTTLLPE